MGQEAGRAAELRDAAKVVAEALSRLGRNFDPARVEDLDRTVLYVSGLMATDRTQYEELVVALIRAEEPVSKAAGWLRRLRTAQPDAARAKPFFPVAIQAPRTPADDLLMDDEPSRGQLLRALDTVAREKGHQRNLNR
jgi:hypothetical protein